MEDLEDKVWAVLFLLLIVGLLLPVSIMIWRLVLGACL